MKHLHQTDNDHTKTFREALKSRKKNLFWAHVGVAGLVACLDGGYQALKHQSEKPKKDRVIIEVYPDSTGTSLSTNTLVFSNVHLITVEGYWYISKPW